MTDETNVTLEEEEAEAPAQLIDEEGNFVENWTHYLKDESLRDDPTLKTIKTLDMFAKNHILQRKKIGGNTVLIPNEASSQAEWDEYYAAGGRPKTAADYAFTKPDDMPDENYSKDRAEKYMNLFHKLGISKKQAAAIFNENNTEVMTELKKYKQDADLAMTELVSGLTAEWGSAYEQRKHLGNIAIEQGAMGNEEFKTRLCQKFGNDPDFIRYSSNLGAKFAEAGAVDVSKLVPTPSDIQAKIDEEMVNPAYGKDYAKHGFTKSQHLAQVKKVSQLFAEKSKHIKTG